MKPATKFLSESFNDFVKGRKFPREIIGKAGASLHEAFESELKSLKRVTESVDPSIRRAASSQSCRLYKEGDGWTVTFSDETGKAKTYE